MPEKDFCDHEQCSTGNYNCCFDNGDELSQCLFGGHNKCPDWKPGTTKKVVRMCRQAARSASTGFRMSQIPYALVATKKGLSNKPNGFFVGLTRRILSLALTITLLVAIWKTYEWGQQLNNDTIIIIITPTHKRPERFADMTRFSQTLMHIKGIHWVVIEDGNHTVPAVERILQRSKIPYTYFYTTTMPGFPKRGWTHRNMGLEYIRKHYRDYNRNAVVYFADDDNSYDIRLFDKYIKNVKTIGVWAVGLAGAALVEAPHVENGQITKWDVVYAPMRRFATDMAGFAVNLNLILNTNATFHSGCVKVSPESCFLAQFGIPKEKVEPFGYNDDPKEVLVWHTKTRNIGTKGDSHGYVVE
ncbi:glycosyltransferase family 43 domain-containing protein [Ditylenchus destructor]|uniref:Galactosylgalactosylxylosylprotein 3-beta-glucuronosyltransferase n=1 Tax=Ditylenchus destructor TaxID=166010 RepID=A0AAD4R6Q2_9BILA|nr:glycosyltransferase family 43 domain-containing protein [Ditylenchus destructor]